VTIGMDKAELQQLYEKRSNAYRNLASGTTDPQILIHASAVALLEIIEANNRKMESQLRAKGIQI